MDNKLHAKDLINVGIFTAIYFVIFFVTGMIGYIPIMMVAIPFLCPLTTGIPFLLFLTRVQKFGMVTIMGALLAIGMFLFGHPWTCIPAGLGFAVLSDLILKSGKYRNWTSIRLGYMVFSQWLIGLMVPFFFMRDTYFETLRNGYGDTYADTLMAITPMWAFGLVIVFAAGGGLLGVYMGKALLKKHFTRAGIA